MSGLLWWISRSVWMVKSHNSLTSSFSSTLLGECSYHLSLHSTPYSLHTSQWMTRPTTSCLFLYSVCASLGQLHKICCTVSSWLPHILHLDDTFWFSILAFTAFFLSAWSYYYYYYYYLNFFKFVAYRNIPFFLPYKSNLVPRGRDPFGQRQGPLPVPLAKATRTLGTRLIQILKVSQ